ncbi:MAG: PaaI family thioesterase, partial [Clostridiales bacterium]|nr:PaaI family thioesterase [Clostridiales bacterium]
MNYKINKVQNVSRMCAVCGIENAGGLKTRFFEIDCEGRPTLAGVPAALDVHQSYPNRMHGGLIGALLDETIGRAVQIRDEALWGVTVELNLRYRKPVPLDAPIVVLGFITAETSRTFEGEGKIILPATGDVLAFATAKYVKLPPDRICGDDFLHTAWFPDTRPAPR